MRIRKIRIKNLNSLKGEYNISLDEEPVSSSGIFAIVGPTGAGKSTILDAISLALYGRTPRLGNITDKVIESGGIITRDCNDAYAEVEFEVKNVVYCSSWKASFTKTGNANAPKMSIFQKGEATNLAENKSEVLEVIKKIVGLDEAQFSQSILLSQGKFKEFLEAKPDDRAMLLEKMTGAWIYRKIGKLVAEKHSEVKAEYESLEKEIAAVSVLTDEEIEQQKEVLSDKKKKLAASSQELKVLIEDLNNVSLLDQFIKQLSDLTKGYEQAELGWKNFEGERTRLQQHEKASTLSSYFLNIDNRSNEIKEKKSGIARHVEIVQAAEGQIQTVFKQLSALSAKDVTEKNFKLELVGLRDKVAKLDLDVAAMEKLEQSIHAGLRTKFAGLPNEIRKEISSDQEKNFNIISNALSKLMKEIAQLKKADNINDEELERLIASADEKLRLYPELKQLMLSEKMFADRQTELEKQKSLFEENVPFIKERIHQCEKDKISLEAELKLIISETEKEELKGKVHQYRSLLVKGKPCPLCGSLHHEEVKTEDNVLKVLADKKTKTGNALQEVIANLNKSTLELRNYEDQIKKGQIEIQNCFSELEKIKRLMEPVLLKLNINQGLRIGKIDAFISEAEANKQRLKVYQDKLAECKGLQGFLEVLKEYLKCRDEHNQKKKERNEAAPADALKILESINSTFTKASVSIEASSAEIKNLSAGMEKAETELKKLQSELAEKTKLAGFANTEEARLALLKESEADSLRKKEKQLKEDLISFKSNLKTKNDDIERQRGKIKTEKSAQQLKELSEELSALCDSLNKDIWAAEELLKADQKNRKLLGNLNEKLKALLTKLNLYKIMNDAIGDRDGDKFSKIMQRFTLRHLISLSNERLNQLSGRYLLYVEAQSDQSAKDKTMDQLMVIDRHMGDVKRIVSTLSGGESFLVSLSLALALSDLAAGNIQIQSFFIDEGFGTLDAATLDLAMSTLEKLQAENGKTVGIISHVDTLKERIACQVKVIKGVNGYSRVEPAKIYL